MIKHIIIIYALTVGLGVATPFPFFSVMANTVKENQLIKIKLNSKKYPNYYALVDNEDFDKIKKYTWHYEKNATGTARTNYRGIHLLMHRIIINAEKNEIVDHINHNTLDNRKCNLRICNPFQNNGNRMPRKGYKYKGITKRKNYDKWRAEMRYRGNHISLGDFNTEIEAAKAYNCAARILHGEFAYLNVI